MENGVALGRTLLSYLQVKYRKFDESSGMEIIDGLKILPQAGGSPPSQDQMDMHVETVLSSQTPLVFGYVDDSGTTVPYFHSASRFSAPHNAPDDTNGKIIAFLGDRSPRRDSTVVVLPQGLLISYSWIGRVKTVYGHSTCPIPVVRFHFFLSDFKIPRTFLNF
jgi:hypothetical protein